MKKYIPLVALVLLAIGFYVGAADTVSPGFPTPAEGRVDLSPHAVDDIPPVGPPAPTPSLPAETPPPVSRSLIAPFIPSGPSARQAEPASCVRSITESGSCILVAIPGQREGIRVGFLESFHPILMGNTDHSSIIFTGTNQKTATLRFHENKLDIIYDGYYFSLPYRVNMFLAIGQDEIYINPQNILEIEVKAVA
ncbi:hypothetical protein J4460_07820 [Candidatus Woesearchaeota archaeon]|nr:MAG: hypothetical protein QS99_C0011G0043 [archaeon GW2011_AR4]MBS3130546.1 hypothetical protein [Candidatus Woesearchaeota archaeon]HIH38026.1 hypothetical protein [Candidatus Woesearchaeota archaeon]HIH48383.1 hypothetical protein [Candidatus Woesearchaeota archaeon]HIJ02995.1 hypothetical protein [Candidatus Woesearchaeota archaeon]